MTRILLVRMSSLGDILHTFPALTDLRRARPDAVIDWVVEEAYVELAAMHRGVTNVIPVALRRWRRQLFSAGAWREFAQFRRQLAGARYDAILDTQGLVKSVFVARLARGPIHGFGPRTAREPIAARCYDFKYEFAPSDHKVERYRAVAARALRYSPAATVDYGLTAPPKPASAPQGPYGVLLHSTARAAKLWDEAGWIDTARALEKKGLVCVLPWGSPQERQRAERMAAAIPRASVPERMSILEAAGWIAHARVVVGVDTGLMHLAAALCVPVVGVFCDSEPLDARPVGAGPTAFRGAIGRPPSAQDVLDAVAEVAPAVGRA